MPAGRNFLIKKNNVDLAGVRSKSMAFGGEPIDDSDADDDGYRTLLTEAAGLTLDVSVEGVIKDDTMRAVALGSGSKLLTDITLAFPDGDTISGDFFLTAYEESGPYKDAQTFSASLSSSGAWTYTPGA